LSKLDLHMRDALMSKQVTLMKEQASAFWSHVQTLWRAAIFCCRVYSLYGYSERLEVRGYDNELWFHWCTANDYATEAWRTAV
jgi:hypothetical protein